MDYRDFSSSLIIKRLLEGLALAILHDGANGKTREELRELLMQGNIFAYLSF